MTNRLFTLNKSYTTTQIETSDDVINSVINGNLEYVKKYSKNVLEQTTDLYKNNLLHIATKSKQYTIIEYLLTLDINYETKNNFGYTPYDVALQLHDKISIAKYNNNKLTNKIESISRTNAVLSLENTRAKKILHDNDVLKTLNKSLVENNDILEKKLSNEKIKYNTQSNALTTEVVFLRDENGVLTRGQKRLREENLKLTVDKATQLKEIKKLRLENSNLNDKNKELKTAIESMTKLNKNKK